MGFQKITAGLLLAAFTATSVPPVLAQPAASTPLASSKASTGIYAKKLHLAYIRSADTLANNVMQRGLEGLAAALKEKTSVEPEGVVGLDIERDELALFPIIYWPVSESVMQLSEKAQKKVQTYLDTGGLIIFDLKNTNEPVGSLKGLNRLLGNVTLKYPAAMGKDHVLHQTFYRLEHLRGSFNYNTVLVEKARTRGAENVSSVIIGENNWAGAWAGLTLPQGSREKEMAMRTGINMVMYALTGNYKSDQAQIMKTIDKLDK
jgi:hypothetical protein